jgi:integrase
MRCSPAVSTRRATLLVRAVDEILGTLISRAGPSAGSCPAHGPAAYAYLREVFRHRREELGVEVARAPKKLPYVPAEAEISAFYDAVRKARRASDVILIQTLLYAGVRVSELVRIRIADVDLGTCRIRII